MPPTTSARSQVPSARDVSDAELIEKIRQVHDDSDGTYGSPRVHQELLDRGVACGRRRVRRLMRLHGLEGRCKKRWRKTTIQDPAAEAEALDLIQRHFGPSEVLDARYVGDITYIATWEGWAYLATVIDLASRRVVGWALADHMRTELISDALLMAFGTRRPPAGVIFHSDRGCQYTSRDFRQLAIDHGVVLSLGPQGDVLGQRRGRELLRHHQTRAHRPPTLADHRRPTPSRLRLDRRLVQHPPTSLLPRLPQPGPIRSPHPPKHQQPQRHNQLNKPVRQSAPTPLWHCLAKVDNSTVLCPPIPRMASLPRRIHPVRLYPPPPPASGTAGRERRAHGLVYISRA